MSAAVAYICVVCTGIGCGTYLICHEHPVIGGLLVVLSLFVSVSSSDSKNPK